MESTLSAPLAGTELVTTSTAQLWLGDDGIFRIRCLPGSMHTLEKAKENLAAYRSKLKNKVPALIDLREIGAITREAREFWRSPANDQIRAAAILVDSPLSVAIGNFFTGLSKMAVEHRLFKSEAAALVWLKTFLK